jgi:aryl-alcohol dehydrogenase-like predicted oxidoreductase
MSNVKKEEAAMMIEQAELGRDGPLIGRLGYGAMVLEGYYGASDDKEAVKVLCHAIDSGMMIDSADAYGNGHNELLIAKALKASRGKAFTATKFGIVFDADEAGTELLTGWGFSLKINGTPAYAHKALNASLKRLGVDVIDLWYLHYPDPATPVEESVAAMSEAVSQGKVRYIGLSNVTAAQVRAAHAVHPIAAVQYEYSLWRREAEAELLQTLRDLGIGLVGWSPLGAGFLAGAAEFGSNDFRRNNPRCQGENLRRNQDRFAPLSELAKELSISPAQLALAWLLNQGKDIFPIPGTRKLERIDENAQSLSVAIDSSLLSRINAVAPIGIAVGGTLI